MSVDSNMNDATMTGSRIGGSIPQNGMTGDTEDTSPLPFMANLASALSGIRAQKHAQNQERKRWDSLIEAINNQGGQR